MSIPEKINTFLNHPFIKEISLNSNWTITQPKTKMPIDAYAMLNRGRIFGAAFDRGYNPLVTLPQLLEWFEDQTKGGYNIYPKNLCYYLQAEHDRHIILDIEPSCDKKILNELLDTMPYSYAETSMSGQGVHLGFVLPPNHQLNFQDLSVIKRKEKDYEFLMNNKFCTFTMNPLQHNQTKRDDDALRLSLMPMYAAWKEQQTEKVLFNIGIAKPDIPEEEYILRMSSSIRLGQTLEDCHHDYSRYEFKYAAAILFRLKSLTGTSKLKNIQYEPEQITWLIYEILLQKLEYRPKHDEIRHNMPWLLYIAKDSVQKMWAQSITDVRKKEARK